jgi:putative hydrolase of the HAD superfamily
MNFPTNKIFVFDLDDTLYSEFDFQKSGIIFVCKTLNYSKSLTDIILSDKKNWVQNIILNTNNKLTKSELLFLYRNHLPNICLYNDAKLFLNILKKNNIEISLITDGRSITQKNKLRSLGIHNVFRKIIISDEIHSEKPSEINYKLVMSDYTDKEYIYIADNPNKDFITPNKLGWTTICLLDRGYNIHKQNFNLSKEYLPQKIVKSFDEINQYYEF